VDSPRKSNLVLIGYRGSGKTAVGRLCAERLGYAWIDTDARIVAAAGVSIAEIFEREGEPGFRDREARAIAAAADGARTVISAGGGAILRDDNVARLRASGFVVWLTAPPDVLWSRIRQDAASAENRPSLTSGSGLAEVREVLAARADRYRRAADAQVDASCEGVPAVVEHVLAAYWPSAFGRSSA
jgi:shikimate kinase